MRCGPGPDRGERQRRSLAWLILQAQALRSTGAGRGKLEAALTFFFAALSEGRRGILVQSFVERR